MFRQTVTSLLVAGVGFNAAAFDADWLDGDDEIDFPNIQCPDGSCDGQVELIAPLDQIYNNSCFAAEATGGTPALDIDTVNRTIEIEFQPAKGLCPGVFDPVAGVLGTIAAPDDPPLSDGQWTLFANNPAMQFTLRFQIPSDATDGIVDFTPGDSPPSATEIDCNDADCSGLIEFAIPTDTYTNSCLANLSSGGSPVLTRDDDTNSVELWFAPPRATVCPAIVSPVTGLDGVLGPLAPGTWSFYGNNAEARFVTIINVSGFSRDWIPGTNPPAEWQVMCDTEDCTGTVTFEGPSPEFQNTCQAALTNNGVPNLVVDANARTIELVVAPPTPVSCSAIYLPVAGLSGTFGDLEDGEWTFFSDSALGVFSIPFTVGESCASDTIHTADQDGDNVISLSELLRVIQFFNSTGLGCETDTEDGYAPNVLDQACCPHESDYNPQDWTISLSELLRLIQFFNSTGYNYCPGDATEDGFCPGL